MGAMHSHASRKPVEWAQDAGFEVGFKKEPIPIAPEAKDSIHG